MDVTTITAAQSVRWAKDAYEAPARLLGKTVDELMGMSIQEHLQLASDLEYLTKQIETAYCLLYTGLCIRERMTPQELRILAINNYKLRNAGGYYPHMTFVKSIGPLFFAIEQGAIDTSCYCVMAHYRDLVSTYMSKASPAVGELLIKAGITPRRLINVASKRMWVSNFFRKLLKRFIEMYTTDEERVEFVYRAFSTKYIDDIMENAKDAVDSVERTPGEVGYNE